MSHVQSYIETSARGFRSYRLGAKTPTNSEAAKAARRAVPATGGLRKPPSKKLPTAVERVAHQLILQAKDLKMKGGIHDVQAKAAAAAPAAETEEEDPFADSEDETRQAETEEDPFAVSDDEAGQAETEEDPFAVSDDEAGQAETKAGQAKTEEDPFAYD